ncbi:unnamed protein product, partial [Coccothraustes coccothraustes]
SCWRGRPRSSRPPALPCPQPRGAAAPAGAGGAAAALWAARGTAGAPRQAAAVLGVASRGAPGSARALAGADGEFGAAGRPRRCRRRAGASRAEPRGAVPGRWAGGAARALRWPRPVPAALPAPGAVPAPPGRGSGRGSPGRRRPCVPEEPPEEPLSCREPRSVPRRPSAPAAVPARGRRLSADPPVPVKPPARRRRACAFPDIPLRAAPALRRPRGSLCRSAVSAPRPCQRGWGGTSALSEAAPPLLLRRNPFLGARTSPRRGCPGWGGRRCCRLVGSARYCRRAPAGSRAAAMLGVASRG